MKQFQTRKFLDDETHNFFETFYTCFSQSPVFQNTQNWKLHFPYLKDAACTHRYRCTELVLPDTNDSRQWGMHHNLQIIILYGQRDFLTTKCVELDQIRTKKRIINFFALKIILSHNDSRVRDSLQPTGPPRTIRTPKDNKNQSPKSKLWLQTRNNRHKLCE